MITFTEDQATALVTDAGTLKRGRELAGPAKWGNLGRTDTAAWGECAGSGSKPYLVGIDLSEPAFKCSCPSRVFPCKHGAGLLLLLARQPALLPAGTPPTWLAEWLDKRQAKGDEQAEKAAAKTAKKVTIATPADTAEAAPEAAEAPATTAAQQKREAQRHARMQAGALDFENWLLDLLRAGLADLERKPASFWEDQAARLVDNQLPGLAAVLRELAELPTAGPDWSSRLLGRLGELYVLVRAFLNRDNLAPTARQDVWQQVGITPKKDDLLANPAAVIVVDTWLALGQYAWEEERVTGRRSWLFGQNSGRTALVLDFAFGSQPFATALVPQGKYAGELVFYPGLLPLRAAPINLVYKGSAADATPPGQGIADLLESYASALARQPWLRQWPAALGPVLPTPLPDGSWLLHSATEPLALPLRIMDEDIAWQWLALSGGQPLTLFGEWDGQAYLPVICWTEDRDISGNPLVLDDFFVAGASAGQAVDALLPLGTLPVAGAAPVAPATRPAAATRHNAAAATNAQTAVASTSEGEIAAASASASQAELTAADLPAWPTLLRLALLGTRQSAEVLPAFPTLPATGSREQNLLLAAGALALMQKAGYQPAAATTPAPTPAPPDHLPALGPLGTECLHQMLVRAQHLDLLPDYLRQVAAAGRRVPEALLMPLLQHAVRSIEARSHLAELLGERGRWLAALNLAWAKLFTPVSPATDPADPTNLTTWETGLLPERLAWLRQAFARDSDTARALLLAALPTEPAKTQGALLKILAEHLHPDAEPALETLLKSRGQEVRRLAAALLVRLPGAALTGRLWARAAPLITARRKLLGLGKAELEITLPTAWDKTWLADGIEEKNDQYLYLAGHSKAAVGAGAARLANLLALLPVGRWLPHLGLSADELLTAALASEWAVPLLPAWALSTLSHEDPELAAAFVRLWLGQSLQLQKLKIHFDIEALSALLPEATRRQLLVPKLVLHLNRAGTESEPALAALAQAEVLPGPWPWALTEAALAVVALHTTHTAGWLSYERRRFGTFISQTLPGRLAPADAPAAAQLLAAIAEPHEFYAEQFRTFSETVRFRADLAASL
ncbi:MAG TPA: DUF5691 domain-containing protein, partial [Hymenobacter sp.]|uniref:SWIM zinc finger family protein n=1 Tax=Hymenobacter sp. TaxID=1898978 RepID=UPI002D80ECC5